MNNFVENQSDLSRPFRLPLTCVALILAYFASQVLTFILAGLLIGVEIKQISSLVLFSGVALNAFIWIVITLVFIPRLNLPEENVSTAKECLKHYFKGLGIMYLTLIFFGLLLSLAGFQPQTQEVAGQIAQIGRQHIFLALIGPAILIPFIEELLFRSLLYRSLKISLSPLIAAIISAAIFGLVHKEPDVIAQLMALGMVFTYVYEKSGSIYVAVALHATNNFVAVIGITYGDNINNYLQSLGFFVPVFR